MTGVRRACEGCRLRRVKCNGYPDRCHQCSHLNLKCVYPTNTTNTSRSGIARGSVISRLKQSKTSKEPSTACDVASTAKSGNVYINGIPGHGISDQETAPVSASLNSQDTLFSAEFFRGLIDDYSLYVYPVNPIISPSEILQSIDLMHQPGHGVDDALVYSYAAVTLNLTTDNSQPDPSRSTRIRQLVGLALKARNAVMAECMSKITSRIEPVLTARLVMPAIFIEMCLMADGKTCEAFIVLREAIAMIQLLEIDRLVVDDGSDQNRLPSQYPNGTHIPAAERSRLIRLYWEAFIHERFLMVVAYYPTALPPLPANVSLPSHDASIPEHVNVGWQCLMQLFSVLDHEFAQAWLSSSKSNSTQVTAAWIERKMRCLDELHQIDFELYHTNNLRLQNPASVMQPPSPSELNQVLSTATACLTTLQKADLIVTRQWLLMLLWQLAVSNCVLTSETESSKTGAMSLQFPARLSQQLRHVVTSLGRQSVERHGSGILQKLFEITNALADVILHVPTDSAAETAQRLDDFNFLFEFLRNSSNLTDIQIRILMEKHTQIMTLSWESAGS